MKVSRCALWFVSAVALLSISGCAVVSPPAMLPRHDGPDPMAVGDTQLMALVGVGLGIFLDAGYGVVLRATHQADELARLGLEVGLGRPLGQPEHNPGNHPSTLFSMRVLGRLGLSGVDEVAFDAGLGVAATDKRHLALTIDTGALLGEAISLGEGPHSARLTPYGGPTLALSIPLFRGEPIYGVDSLTLQRRADHARYIDWTLYVGTTLGVEVESGGRRPFGGSLEGALLYGVGSDEVVILSGSLAPSLTLSR